MSKLTVDVEFPDKLAFLVDDERRYRYAVTYGGRGGAKSWAFARAMLIQLAKEKRLALCTREVQNSLQDSVHRLLCNQIEAMQLTSFYSSIQNKIRAKNGSEIVFAGLSNLTAESIKSYEGVDICWVEEAQGVRQRSWDMLIPTIRKDGSEVWVSMNPELETDDTYRRFIEHPPANSKVVEVNWRDNPWFPQVLQEEREEFLRQVARGKRSQDDYDNIWEGKCRTSVYGAIFGKELGRSREQGRIKVVPWNPKHLVYTAWDIGKGDPTAIWFFQSYAGEVAFIDYFEDKGEDITYYLQKLASKDYKYATHYFPHDAKHDRIGMPKTIEQTVRDNGYRVEVIPVRSLKDQINEARLLLSRAQFDETKCGAGLEALRHYKWAYNQAMDELKPTPLHDWSSHAASAFMGAAMSFKEHKLVIKRPERPKWGGAVA